MNRPAADKTVFRLKFTGLVFALIFAAIGAKAVHIQVIQGAWLSEKAEDQYTQAVTAHFKRGGIWDANGSEMGTSIQVSSLAARPDSIQDPKKTARLLAKVLDTGARKIEKRISADTTFVWVKRQLGPKETAAVRDLALEGLEFIPEYCRFYPHKTLAAQVLGFSGIDGRGLEGIEYFYDNVLKGGKSKSIVVKDARGRAVAGDATPPVKSGGDNIVLTINRKIQYIVEKSLEEAVAESGAKSGMALVMAPSTGAVLAMANYPFFNPNVFRKADPLSWRNRCVTDLFEPGSTMKMFTAAAALDSGMSRSSTIFFCENGAWTIAGHTVRDTHAHGWLTLSNIVKYSSNIGAAKVSDLMGPQRFHAYLDAFGFGQKTGIDCPGEPQGRLIPHRNWSKMDKAAIAFGHGISVSAIQMAAAASAVANNGVLMKPYLVEKIVSQKGEIVRRTRPVAVRQVISEKTARSLRRILTGVIEPGGTGTKAALDGYTACGKTGTAKKTDETGAYTSKYLSSFLGMAPADKPEIVVLVVIDEPQKQGVRGRGRRPGFQKNRPRHPGLSQCSHGFRHRPDGPTATDGCPQQIMNGRTVFNIFI